MIISLFEILTFFRHYGTDFEEFLCLITDCVCIDIQNKKGDYSKFSGVCAHYGQQWLL